MSLLPQIGFLELMVLAVLALVVVGPKDLPKLMRAIGKFFRQARQMADEFRAGFDEMARETEMAELREEIESLKKNNPVNEIKSAVEDTVRQADGKMGDGKPAPQEKPVKGSTEAKAEQAADQTDAETRPAEKTEGGA